MGTKRCPQCKQTKLVEEFVKSKAAKNGLHGWCKLCLSAYSVRWTANHPGRKREVREGVGRVRYLIYSIRSRAKRLGIECSITEADVVIPDTCPVLGMPLITAKGVSQYNSATVDRIDPSIGYVPGNVQVMSKLANMMKNNATPEQLLAFADWAPKTYTPNGKLA